jgi:hypothetical protein
MRRFLRTLTSLLTAWIECATAKRTCLLSRIKEILGNGKPTRLELALIALALSAMAAGFLLPGESAVVADTLRLMPLP